MNLPPASPDATPVPALVFTCFVFGANNYGTPLGGHMFVYPLEAPRSTAAR